MAQAAKAQEPSMEEILASIRRIIADDEPKPAEPPKAAAKPAPAPPPPVAARPSPPPPPAPPPPAPPPAPVVSTSDPDINALLAEIGEATLQEPEPEIAAEPEPDILELTEEMAEIEPAAFQTVEPQEEVVFEEHVPEPAYTAPAQYQPMPDPSTSPPLMSPSTMASVGSAFNSLAHTILSDNARTLEDLVREMLRPMLKAWLDDNLPGMVERIVRSEIERVSRGR